jgi:hypothetical protein
MPKSVVCNCDYNMAKQLAKTSQFLWNIDTYVKDAKKEGHSGCVKMWEAIRKDAERHAKLLSSQIKKKVKVGEFC